MCVNRGGRRNGLLDSIPAQACDGESPGPNGSTGWSTRLRSLDAAAIPWSRPAPESLLSLRTYSWPRAATATIAASEESEVLILYSPSTISAKEEGRLAINHPRDPQGKVHTRRLCHTAQRFMVRSLSDRAIRQFRSPYPRNSPLIRQEPSSLTTPPTSPKTRPIWISATLPTGLRRTSLRAYLI